MTSTAGPGQQGLARSVLADPTYGPLPALLLILTAAVTGVVDGSRQQETRLGREVWMGRGR